MMECTLSLTPAPTQTEIITEKIICQVLLSLSQEKAAKYKNPHNIHEAFYLNHFFCVGFEKSGGLSNMKPLSGTPLAAFNKKSM
jgi:hypothetical protein